MTRSTGPTTAAGKAKSAQNAVKHGLLAGKWLPPDEKAAMEALLRDLHAEYQPSTATQRLMIDRIAMSMTKLRRLHVIEDAMHVAARVTAINGKRDKDPLYMWVPDDLLEAGAFPPLEVWGLLARYQTALNRQISKSIGELMVLKGMETIPSGAQTPAVPSIAAPTKAKLAKVNRSYHGDEHGPLAGKWLGDEERSSLAQLVQELRVEYSPTTATHDIMIERIAMAMTKVRRLHELEDAMHATARVHVQRMHERSHPRFEGMDADLAQAAAVPFVGVWAMIGQYQGSLDREISKSIGELLQIKTLALRGGAATMSLPAEISH